MKENSEKELQALEVIIVHILSLRVRNFSLNMLCTNDIRSCFVQVLDIYLKASH